MKRPRKPATVDRSGLTPQQIQELRAHASTRPQLRRNADLFVFRLGEGDWWARRQLARTEEERREEERSALERSALAEHARQFRDRLRARVQGAGGDVPIWGSKGVDLAKFSADLEVIAAGLIEEGKGGAPVAPDAVWRDELIALVDDTYSALDPEDHDSRAAQQHRKKTIALMLEWLGAPAVSSSTLGSVLRDSRRRRVLSPLGRLTPPLRIVGER